MGRGVGRDSATAIVWRTRGRPSLEIEEAWNPNINIKGGPSSETEDVVQMESVD